MKPRLVFAIAFPVACLAMAGPYTALTILLVVSLPVLWLGSVGEKASVMVRRRVSMTSVAGPSRFYPCTYCGRPADAWDHVFPWSRGGNDGPGNRVPACTSCNSSKGDDTPEEWWQRIGRGAEIPAHWPRTGVTSERS